jgi:hypothetical protein
MRDTAAAPSDDGPVEDYLDRLLLTMGGSPRQVRHTLAEVEAHLHDAVAEEMAAGKSRLEAEAAAVARIGSVHDITGRGAAFGRPKAALARRAVLAASLIGGVGLVAIGISGAISWALAAVRGGASSLRRSRPEATPALTARDGSQATRRRITASPR